MVVSMKFTYLYLNNTLQVVIINPCLQLVVVFYMVANLSENICNVFMQRWADTKISTDTDTRIFSLTDTDTDTWLFLVILALY